MKTCVGSVLVIATSLGAPVSAAPKSVDLITEIDALGYACIDEAYFVETNGEAATAFQLGGKIRLPRTCVADPCAGALSQRELSNLTGTPFQTARFAQEWDDYYARYADYCRKETTPDGGRVAESPEEFWKQTQEPAQIANTIVSGSPVLPIPQQSGLSPTSYAPLFTPISFNTDTGIENFTTPNLFSEVSNEGTETNERISTSDSGEVLGTTESIVTVVPLSGSLAFLGLGALAIGSQIRRRR